MFPILSKMNFDIRVIICYWQNALNLDRSEILGQYSSSILIKILCLFLKDFVNLNATQLLIGLTIRLSELKVVLHSNVAKYRKVLGISQRTFSRMLDEYWPWCLMESQSASYYLCVFKQTFFK